jgi:hypothetical protein
MYPELSADAFFKVQKNNIRRIKGQQKKLHSKIAGRQLKTFLRKTSDLNIKMTISFFYQTFIAYIQTPYIHCVSAPFCL